MHTTSAYVRSARALAGTGNRTFVIIPLLMSCWLLQATEDDEQQPLVYTSQQQQQGSARNTLPQQADKGSSGAQAYHQIVQETTSQQRPGVLYQVPWDIW